ncbi:urease accessory protein UreD [Helicobacter cappadocius]|uniref:Urease accessory protein UreD n=1 Tax=Helicobacter cappadocius TaxID=3063998 RepID=A0AA90TBN7_9HELI|nr:MULTISPECIES: urease accessory protein UreD [unclassified Helicobacter]MDO7252912.1 urease accessory protein UreD [Helicobacter sp. faydin-H75]MDP2538956.1 urease accessory protein UreD [Helicobacter sp. faydin-H76]
MTSYAQETSLKLKTKVGQNGKTIIEDAFFTPPLKLMSPFYEDDDIANIMLISVSAGLLKGDCQKLNLEIGENCRVKLSSQSFEKIHNTEDGYASRDTDISIGENAAFDFSPLPIIPFGNSDFRASTTIHMHSNSKLIYSEIICAGRISRDEIFNFKNFTSVLKIYRDNKAIFFDNTILQPEKLNLQNMCMFDEFTHYLNLLIFDSSISIEYLKELLEEMKLNGAVSELSSGGLCLKALCKGSEELIKLREKVSL